MNSVQLIGRLTKDPEADQTSNGTPVATFRLAVGRPGSDVADFVTVKVWDRLAQAVAEHLSRGRRVAVLGRLFHDEWVGANGQRSARMIVIASRVEFLDTPTAGDSRVAGPAANSTADEPRRTRSGHG